MNNPMVHAFFIGRALASALGEQVELLVNDGLSQLGRFDAEQRENLRKFTEQVLERAQQEEAISLNTPDAVSGSPAMADGADLQALIDNLRAEIAQLRATLQQYRASS